MSQVEMYLRCARQYEFRYILGQKNPPAVALTEGTSHHEAMSFNNEILFKSRLSAPESQIIEVFSDTFADKSRELTKESWKQSGETIDSVIRRGHGLIREYVRTAGVDIVPSSLPEERVEMMVGGVPVLGFIDVEDKENVLDYKVVSSCKSTNDAANDLQLTLYSKAREKEGVGFVCFVKTSVPRVAIIRSTRNKGDYAVMDAIFGSVADAIKKGAFPMCSPANTFPCSEKWCGFWKMCRGKIARGANK